MKVKILKIKKKKIVITNTLEKQNHPTQKIYNTFCFTFG